MSFFRRVKDHFVPSRDNAYRPHLLRRSALIALLAVVILAEGALVAGVIYDPMRRELFSAVKGGGATLNGRHPT